MAPTAGRTAPKSRSDGVKCRSNGAKCQSGGPQPSVEWSPSAGLTASSAGRLLLARVEPLAFRDALLVKDRRSAPPARCHESRRAVCREPRPFSRVDARGSVWPERSDVAEAVRRRLSEPVNAEATSFEVSPRKAAAHPRRLESAKHASLSSFPGPRDQQGESSGKRNHCVSMNGYTTTAKTSKQE